jgi:hypothetical protein
MEARFPFHWFSLFISRVYLLIATSLFPAKSDIYEHTFSPLSRWEGIITLWGAFCYTQYYSKKSISCCLSTSYSPGVNGSYSEMQMKGEKTSSHLQWSRIERLPETTLFSSMAPSGIEIEHP